MPYIYGDKKGPYRMFSTVYCSTEDGLVSMTLIVG